jgi:hypothetical protein
VLQDGRQRMQQKTFTAWVNSHLSREGLAIENLSTDFADGIKLIKLVEVISEEPLGKYNKKPVGRVLHACTTPLQLFVSTCHPT